MLTKEQVERLNLLADSLNMDDYHIAQELVIEFVRNGEICPEGAKNDLMFCFAMAKCLEESKSSITNYFKPKL